MPKARIAVSVTPTRNSCLYVPYSSIGIARARTSGTTVVTTALANRATTSGPARRRKDSELIGGAKVRPLPPGDTGTGPGCRAAGGRPPRLGTAPARPALAQTP